MFAPGLSAFAAPLCTALRRKRTTPPVLPLLGFDGAAFAPFGGCETGLFEEMEMTFAGPDVLAELLSALPKGVLFIADIECTRFTEFDYQNSHR
jgi:hypothetical protein